LLNTVHSLAQTSMSPRQDNPTVYSSQSGRICPDCRQPIDHCICAKKKATITKSDGIVRVQRESKGRGGKVVSLVTGLELNGDDLKKLAGELKRVCGAGGAVKDGVIEIQGDHRDLLVDTLKKRGFTVKKVG
jgi:translation initiation factor 1